MTSASPLAGITVVELGHNVAAPFCGKILAGLGATVVKVENPDGGDPTRDWGPPSSTTSPSPSTRSTTASVALRSTCATKTHAGRCAPSSRTTPMSSSRT